MKFLLQRIEFRRFRGNLYFAIFGVKEREYIDYENNFYVDKEIKIVRQIRYELHNIASNELIFKTYYEN